MDALHDLGLVEEAGTGIDRIYTDLAVIDITDRGLVVRDIHPDLTFEGVRAATGALIAPSEPPSMPLISGGAVAVEP